jgi:hypothetical protein
MTSDKRKRPRPCKQSSAETRPKIFGGARELKAQLGAVNFAEASDCDPASDEGIFDHHDCEYDHTPHLNWISPVYADSLQEVETGVFLVHRALTS